MVGGHAFSRGHLYRILSNPLYAGEIDHKGQRYPGQHPAIIDRETWDAVQGQLARNGHERLVKAHAKEPTLLSGLLYASGGERLVATHAVKQGKRYRYYVSARAPTHPRRSDAEQAAGDSLCAGAASRTWRLPAAEIEPLVLGRLLTALRDRS
jgi:site-specific DNA recombinase